MNQYFSKFFLHWFVLIFVSYLGLIAVQYLVIMPIETMMVKRNVTFVSLLYLPHAVRVLGAWMIGPKSVLALIPASICVYFATRPDTGPLTQANFTANEQQVYSAVVLLSNDTNEPVSIHEIRSHYLVQNIPMPTVYQSFNRLISAEKITHIGGERSGLCAIIA